MDADPGAGGRPADTRAPAPDLLGAEAAAPGPAEATPAGATAVPARRRRWWVEVAETLALTLLIFFVIQTFIAQPYQVEQESMERSFEPGEYVLVDKLTPRFDAYDRGEVVVLRPPAGWALDGDDPFIKRVIAVGGETVEIRDGAVLIDGVVLDEPYVFQEAGRAQPTTTDAEPPRWVVPEGEVFVMGDHRAKSADSRAFGPIPVSTVVGRAWLRYWPLDRFGVLETPTYARGKDLPSGAP